MICNKLYENNFNLLKGRETSFIRFVVFLVFLLLLVAFLNFSSLPTPNYLIKLIECNQIRTSHKSNSSAG